MDAQTIELLGRNRVIDELLQAGIDIAIPVRRDGVDLIAYRSVAAQGGFVACPLQIRASAGRKFTIDHAQEQPSLIHVFVWGVGTDKIASYALTPKEMQRVGDSTGYGLSPTSQKAIFDAPANRSLLDEVERHRMTPEVWKRKLESFTALAAADY